MSSTALHSKKTNGLQELASGREALLKTLAYFDIFNYPLTIAEIKQFMGCSLPDHPVHTLLHQLLEERIIFKQQEFYSLQDNTLLIHRRREGNQRALSLLAKASRIGRFLYGFPFVRAVAVSGSLSKNFADEKADIDFFIITKANRLWIARTWMHLYKKFTFITGRQHYYCMNYYIDEEALLLQEKNIYTAIELKTLLPVTGKKTMEQFFVANIWSDKWLPQCDFRKQESEERAHPFFKRVAEWLLDHRLGDWLDDRLRQITTRRWKQKELKGKRNTQGLVMGLITGKHFAYSNSGFFREKVLARYEKKLRELGIAE